MPKYSKWIETINGCAPKFDCSWCLESLSNCLKYRAQAKYENLNDFIRMQSWDFGPNARKAVVGVQQSNNQHICTAQIRRNAWTSLPDYLIHYLNERPMVRIYLHEFNAKWHLVCCVHLPHHWINSWLYVKSWLLTCIEGVKQGLMGTGILQKVDLQCQTSKQQIPSSRTAAWFCHPQEMEIEHAIKYMVVCYGGDLLDVSSCILLMVSTAQFTGFHIVWLNLTANWTQQASTK